MSRRRKTRDNAGAGYGYMFHGAFKDKKDAVAKEKKTKGAWIKGTLTNRGHRYLVMSPRTNPIKRKRKNPVPFAVVFRRHGQIHTWERFAETAAKATKSAREALAQEFPDRDYALISVKPMKHPEHNPHELLVMGANPHEREFTLPPGSTITIRTNPENPDRFTSAHARASGAQYQAPGLIQTGRQKRVAGLVRGTRTRASKHKYDFLEELGPGGIAPGENPGIGTLLDVASIGTSLPGLLKKRPRKNVELGTYENGVFHPWTRRPNSRQKRALKKQRANPSAEVLREEFTGMEVDRERVAHEPHMPAGNYAQLGKLLKLCVKPHAGGQVLEIRGNNVIVVSDESARQIYFVGGDQDITEALPMFGAIDRGQDVYELGEARSIYYQQRKEHVPDPDQDHWRHEFGEETGERPRALFDARHKRILLDGGAYEVRREGIVN